MARHRILQTMVVLAVPAALLVPVGVAVAAPPAAVQHGSAGTAVDRIGRAPALIGWGANPSARNDVPRRLETARVARLAVGPGHNVVLTRKGTVVAWGANRWGQSDVPAALDGVRVVRIAAGGHHNLAVIEGGSVVAWGDNRRHQCEVPAALQEVRVVQVAAGLRHSLALTEGGNVVAWGDNRKGQAEAPDALDGVRVARIYAGAQHSLALTSDGALVAWGANDAGQSEVPVALQGLRVTKVAAGERHNLALTEGDTVVAWGANRRGQSDVPRSLDGAGVSQIAAGDEHSLALTGKGAVVVWGGRANGKTDLPTVLRGVRVTRVAAGYDHNMVLARYWGPDVQIRGDRRRDLWDDDSPSGRYAGNNFFHTSDRLADTGGVWVADVWSRTSHVFRVRVYNDGRTRRTFRIRGSSAWVAYPGRPHQDPSLVRYYDGDTDVTRDLRSPGGIKVGINAGEFRQYRMWVALVPQFGLVMETSAILSATRVGHPRHSDRVRGSILFVD